MILEVPAHNNRRFHTLSGVSKGDTRSGATREMGAMADHVVVNLSVIGVKPGRRDPRSDVTRADWSSVSVGAAMS